MDGYGLGSSGEVCCLGMESARGGLNSLTDWYFPFTWGFYVVAEKGTPVCAVSK